jgi:pimeloyl-ACP methyl ester carboxylesterase
VATEHEVLVAGRPVLVREAGDPDGAPVLHFHGTPGSRLEPAFGDRVAARLGVRVVSFDRPGYGGSAEVAHDLSAVARDAGAVADALGVDQFAATGWSGGAPYALAAAAVLGERVTRVGVAGGPAPTQQLPGALEALDDNDRLALSFLPDDPAAAARQFLTGNAELLAGLMSVRDDEQAPWIEWMWGETDREVTADAALRRSLFESYREALRQGPTGIAWDNVAFVGPWGFDLEAVGCPVRLWYGEQDLMAPPQHGEWLAAHLPNAALEVFPGEGHLLPMRHWEEILRTLTG